VCLVYLVIISMLGGRASAAEHGYTPRNDFGRIQRLVNELKERLSITQEVTVAIVAVNSRLASVESLKEPHGSFLLALQDDFLDRLTEDELQAVIAHELGHVWIFTHHPYLQTERLANRIAMQLVTRESLAQVYEKMWAHNGSKGDLIRFLGDDGVQPQGTAAAGLSPAPDR
jgi:predicted Zn-dependent protease